MLAEKRTIRAVHRAYREVPFYKKKYNESGVDINSIECIEDLKKLPFVTKDEIRINFPDSIISKKTNPDKCYYSATTGSTGHSLPFLFSPYTYAYYIATNLRVYSMIGYRPWHKAVYIKFTEFKFPSLGPFFRRAHIPSIIPVEEQIEMLKKEKPDILIGYASIILEIARKLTQEDLRIIRPKVISVNSEMSTEQQRNYISQTFGCGVYDEYSTEETWMIASQCREKKYHIFTDNIFVEFIDSRGNEVQAGEAGEIILTTTRSRSMPFIRYRIGDMGTPAAERCRCRRGFQLLNSFEGRADDSFILPDGTWISSLKLLNTFTMYIKKNILLIEEFKMIQRKPDLVEILLVPGAEYSAERFKELTDQLCLILKNSVRIEVLLVEHIESNGSIKRKAIESDVRREICTETGFEKIMT